MHHSYKYLMVTLYHNYFIKLLALSTASIGFASILRIFVSRLIRAIGFLSFNVFVWLWYQGNPGFKRWVQKCSLLFSFWYSLRKIGTNSFKVSENSPVNTSGYRGFFVGRIWLQIESSTCQLSVHIFCFFKIQYLYLVYV